MTLATGLCTLVATVAISGGLSCACFAAPVRSGTPSSKACSRVFTVAASSIGRSMMVSSTGAVSGVVRDFLDLVSQRSGCVFNYVIVPRSRAFVMLETGTVDIVPSVNRTEQRDHFGKFFHLYDNRPMLISLKGRLPSMLGLAQLINGPTTIGIVRGYDYGPAYTALLSDPHMRRRVTVVRGPNMGARMLAAGRMDAVLMAPSAFVDAAEQAGIVDKILVIPVEGLPFASAGMYLVQRDQDVTDLAKVQAAINFLVDRGEYSRLLAKYYAKPRWALGNLKSTPSVTLYGPQTPPLTH